jgi:glycosyltransferase involved in cell wall biosynthesis
MKILMCNKFHFIHGGAERYLFDISEELKKSRHTIIDFSTKDRRNFYSEYSDYFIEGSDFSENLKLVGIADIKQAINFIYSFPARRNIESLIGRYRPDIAHIHNIYHHLSSSIIHSLRKKSIPMVMTVHDYKLICPNYTLFAKNKICERCKRHNYYNAIKYKCIRNSALASILACFETYFCKILKIYESNIDLFITPSRFMQNKLVDFGMDKKKVFYLPYAINLSRFRVNFEPGEHILYFGNMHYRKGVQRLLTIAKQFKNIPIKIIGDGPYKKVVQQLVGDHNLTNVELVEHKPINELIDFVSRALLVIMPSLWYEVAGLTIYESLASGKCVVASNIGAIPEIIKDGVNGVLFNPEDENDILKKIGYLLDSPERIKELGRNGLEMINRYNNLGRHCQTLIEIYDDVINRYQTR